MEEKSTANIRKGEVWESPGAPGTVKEGAGDKDSLCVAVGQGERGWSK